MFQIHQTAVTVILSGRNFVLRRFIFTCWPIWNVYRKKLANPGNSTGEELPNQPWNSGHPHIGSETKSTLITLF